jgi:lincosamide nucleotidyltransferase A/C/D/E
MSRGERGLATTGDDDSATSGPGFAGRLTGSLYGVLKRYRALDSMAVWISRRVRDAPPDSFLSSALGSLRARFRGEMTAEGLLAVVDALEGVGIRFWIAGGWGVDLLHGGQTRRHDDLDVLLADYELDEPRALDALAPLGYRRTEVLDGLWMNPRSLLDDGAGRQIEILGVDRERLDRALDWRGPAGCPPYVEDRTPELFSAGSVLGRRVPCLSVDLQLLFHSGFEARGVDGPDLVLLHELDSPGGQRQTGPVAG